MNELEEFNKFVATIIENLKLDQDLREFSNLWVMKALRHSYAPLVSIGNYCVVWDSSIEDLSEGFLRDRPWDKGSNPKTALFEFLNQLRSKPIKVSETEFLNFEIDKNIES